MRGIWCWNCIIYSWNGGNILTIIVSIHGKQISFKSYCFAVSFYLLHKINMSRVSVLWAVLDRNTVVFNRDKSLYHQSTLSSSSQAAAWGLNPDVFLHWKIGRQLITFKSWLHIGISIKRKIQPLYVSTKSISKPKMSNVYVCVCDKT